MPFPPPPPAVTPTPLAEVDAAIERLHAKKDAWLAVGLPARVALLERCVASIASVAERWAAVGASIKGLAPDDVLAGEEWLAGVMPTISNARLLAEALRAGGERKPPAVRSAPNGQLVARVLPATMMERMLFTGTTVDVWIEKDKPASQGAIYRDRAARLAKNSSGRVCLVLGGGNVSSIPPMDVLYKLFVEDEVVLLKMNPVNEALGPILEEALGPLVDEGVLAIVSGGAEVGSHAAQHERVNSLHVTGSDRTYDAIVWGNDPEERARRKKSGEKLNERSFTAEALGCVTPVIVVPGPWSSADIRFQARHVASMVTQNASFNCNAAKVVVTARGWLQREEFLDALHAELRKTRARKAYYPGARSRHAAFLEKYPNALLLGPVPEEGADEIVRWTAIPDVPADAGGYALTNEAFCGVVAEVTLDLAENEGGVVRDEHGGVSVKRFLEQAVAFANDRCWGTLSCCILIDHATRDDNEEALTKAVTDLRYGGIGINAWPGLIYGLVTPSWGAFPGHPADDIKSGAGVVHNAFLFDHPEKSVVRAPFRIFPTPPWFSDHRNLRSLGQRLVAFEGKPSWGGLFSVVRAALRG